jgi:hypothetical protein
MRLSEFDRTEMPKLIIPPCLFCGKETKTGVFWEGNPRVTICANDECIKYAFEMVIDAIQDQQAVRDNNYRNRFEYENVLNVLVNKWSEKFEQLFWKKNMRIMAKFIMNFLNKEEQNLE